MVEDGLDIFHMISYYLDLSGKFFIQSCTANPYYEKVTHYQTPADPLCEHLSKVTHSKHLGEWERMDNWSYFLGEMKYILSFFFMDDLP